MRAACLLGEGLGGRANVRLDPDLVWDSVLTATREALAAAKLETQDFARIHAGMGAAGAGQAHRSSVFYHVRIPSHRWPSTRTLIRHGSARSAAGMAQS